VRVPSNRMHADQRQLFIATACTYLRALATVFFGKRGVIWSMRLSAIGSAFHLEIVYEMHCAALRAIRVLASQRKNAALLPF